MTDVVAQLLCQIDGKTSGLKIALLAQVDRSTLRAGPSERWAGTRSAAMFAAPRHTQCLYLIGVRHTGGKLPVQGDAA